MPPDGCPLPLAAVALRRASTSRSSTCPAVSQDRLLNRVAEAVAKAQGGGMRSVVHAELTEYVLHKAGHRPLVDAERIRDLLVARSTGDQAENPPFLRCQL